MTTDFPLRCQCGHVRGTALGVAPSTVNRVVCYCDDCQAFAHFLERPALLDAWGGSDISQMAQAQLRITEGLDALRCMRLSPKGLYRWYAGCCQTPIGNTVGPRVPFIGVLRAFFDSAHRPSIDDAIGPPVGKILGKFALPGAPPDVHRTVPPRVMARTAKMLLGWWIGGKASPSPVFDAATKAPRVEPRILTPAERDALRARTGPSPAPNGISAS